MLRYLGLAWDPSSDRDASVAVRVRQRLMRQCPSWHRALDCPGLFVLCHGQSERADHSIVTLGEHGVVLGTLFRRWPLAAPERVTALEPENLDEIERTRGRSLVQTHWGSYVLMLRDRDPGRAYAFRGPMSALPCHYAGYEGVTLLFSVADDLIALNLLRFSINWPRIAAQAALMDHLNDETGLNEVRTLQAGACLSLLGADRRVEPYWTPGSARWAGAVHRFDDAARALRRETLACVGSWASAHDAVLVSLSGGLDSSIVLASLARAPASPRITCVNFHSSLPGDERHHARSMTQRLGVRLIERERDASIDLRAVLRCNRTVSPVLHVTGYDTEPALVALAARCGASAIFDGELGDNLFGSSVRDEVLIEFLQTRGLRPSLIGVARDYALLRRVSVWRALRLAFRHWSAERDLKAWSAERYAREVLHLPVQSRLASAEAITAAEAAADRFTHPWSLDIADLPAGTRQLVFALQIVCSTSYESPFTSPDDPPIISPLTSQPLVELALAIPSCFHIHGGQNRALARAAFAGDLSTSVLHRGRGKATPELWFRRLVEQNRAFLRELLLDGILVRERVLDRRKLEQVLSDRLYKTTASLADLIVQMYIETWLRRWTDPVLYAAA